ncbi:unnamed protein product [Brugia pahangi]|uniref:Cap-specific mRNA (nucleoside-2'-O-)-methyltransferase 1 n=1 Tax=Brugia pahangi TaxID=6280 RepID=A0A0N4TWA9_BRUPA|nr:unnamed protein product [Brugia pahangi]
MIRRLVFTCLEDIRDGFEEELKEMKPMKKPLQNTEKLTDMNTKFPLKSLALRKFEFVDFCKKPKQTHENRGAALLAKMGYDGGGLDKSSQGVTELIPFSTQRGREGFGQPANQRKETLDGEYKYCDSNLMKKYWMLNLAAMKMANLDRIYDWLLMGEKPDNVEIRNPMNVEIKSEKCGPGKNAGRLSPVFYFADICAGPGEFTEYVLWRKGKDDFKLKRFTAVSPSYFKLYCDKHNDGDITKPDNITFFEDVSSYLVIYIVCDNLLACYVSEMKKYMIKINTELDLFWETKVRDVIEVVSENMIYSDKIFMAYILEYNERSRETKKGMLAILGDPGYYQKKKPTKRMNHCLQIIDIKELQQKPPAFTKNVLLSGVGRMRYAELRMCVITKKVLISTMCILYCFVVYRFITVGHKGKLEGERAAVRILDAILLNGDDVLRFLSIKNDNS